jgi:hypothetical protein
MVFYAQETKQLLQLTPSAEPGLGPSNGNSRTIVAAEDQGAATKPNCMHDSGDEKLTGLPGDSIATRGPLEPADVEAIGQ